MILKSTEIDSVDRFNTKKLFKYKVRTLTGRKTISIDKPCIVLGSMGSGKSTFCSRYLSSISKNQLLNSQGLTQNLKQTPTDFSCDIESARQSLLATLEERFKQIVKNHCLTHYFEENNIQLWDYGVNFSRLDGRIFPKTIFQHQVGGDAGDMAFMSFFPKAKISNFLKNAFMIPKSFSVDEIEKLIPKLAISYLEKFEIGSINFKNHYSLASANYLGILKILDDISCFNPSIGVTKETIETKFNEIAAKQAFCDWSIKFILKKKRRSEYVNNRLLKIETEIKVPVFISGDGADYFENELSDTQRLVVHRVLMETAFEFITLNPKGNIFAFDEPTTFLDPASFDVLFSFLESFDQSNDVFIATHDPLLIMKAIEKNTYDFLQLSRKGEFVEIQKITDNPFALRKVLNRVTDGRTFFNGSNNIIESFLKNTPESSLVFCEGKTDVDLLEYFQASVLKDSLYSLAFRNFLSSIKFLFFFEREENSGGAGNLRKIIEEFKMNESRLPEKRIFGLFDGDDAGFKEVGSLDLKANRAPLHGRITFFSETQKVGVLIQPFPKKVLKDFPSLQEVQIEHTLYHVAKVVGLEYFDLGNGSFPRRKKRDVVSCLKSKYISLSRDQKEIVFSEIKRLVEKFQV